MSKSISRTPTKSPARRVLGELTPNARTTPRRSNVYGKQHTITMGDISPLKRHLPSLPTITLNSDHARGSASPTAGRKRTWSEFEAENAENAGTCGTGFGQPNKKERRPSVRPLQKIPVMVELEDEGTTTEEDMSSEPDSAAQSQHSVATKASFSSLVNYHPSQETEDAQPTSTAATSAVVEPTPPVSRAEILRMRLQVAMYKVKTDQTRVPLAQLSLPTANTAANHVGPPSVPLEDPQSQPIPPNAVTVTERHTPLTFPPIPVLRPTAYSTRFITEESYLPSSPPVGAPPRLGSPIHVDRDLNTPIAARRGMASESASPIKRVEGDEENLTSSVVKGRAASGLLELMYGGKGVAGA